MQPFNFWWSTVVIDNRKGVRFTRSELVLLVSECDGGVGVSATLDPRYIELAHRNALGWTYNGTHPFEGAELASIREIAWEVLDTFRRESPRVLFH